MWREENMPKIDIDAIPESNATSYPAPFRELVKGRFRKALGNAGGLTQFGVNLCRLAPGSATAQRHWHEREDELVFVLDGELVLIEDDGETVLKAGEAAAFKAGTPNGHHLVNRSRRDAVLLEIGTRDPNDRGEYPDLDMTFVCENGVDQFLRRDGTPYP
jgi:uncharacterized cupin superfamily protein